MFKRIDEVDNLAYKEDRIEGYRKLERRYNSHFKATMAAYALAVGLAFGSLFEAGYQEVKDIVTKGRYTFAPCKYTFYPGLWGMFALGLASVDRVGRRSLCRKSLEKEFKDVPQDNIPSDISTLIASEKDKAWRLFSERV